MQDAGRALGEMNSFCTPTEKLKCIERCVNCVYLAVLENSKFEEKKAVMSAWKTALLHTSELARFSLRELR